jgi:hypothetical protein
MDGARKRDSQDAKAAKELCQAGKTPANVVERVLVTIETGQTCRNVFPWNNILFRISF